MGMNSQTVIVEATLPLTIPLIESAPQGTRLVASEPILIFLAKGSDVEDYLPIFESLNRKRKVVGASKIPTTIRGHFESTEDPFQWMTSLCSPSLIMG